MPDDRCGYVSDVTGYPRRGRTSCWRPVYGDSDRCIWHADVESKSVRDLGSLEPDPGERLDGAVLSGLSLYGVSWLSGVVLIGADFSDADLREADLSGADLRKCSLADATAGYATFEGANLEDADVTSADLRGADLTNASLDQTTLSGSRINPKTSFGEKAVYESKLQNTDDVIKQRALLESAIRTYRTLETLSQENTFYAQASSFYRQSKDLRRRFNWRNGNYVRALIGELSRLFTGYGNIPMRVIYTSLGVILLWGVAYPLLGGVRQTTKGVIYVLADASIQFDHAVTVLLKSIFFSVVTFTTLGYGDLRPVGTATQYLASVEALLGSTLMALLVAVLTRSTWLR